MSEGLNINYQSEKTPAKFHASNAYVRGIMGPVGSGKSVACCIELVARAMQQEPNHRGIRQFPAAANKTTNPEIKKTTLQQWQEGFHDYVLQFDLR